jgi:hypothetical protein
MKRNVVLALYVEYVLDMIGCADHTERMEDEAEAREWAAVCRQHAQAESNYFERNDEHRDEMDWQDRAGYT